MDSEAVTPGGPPRITLPFQDVMRLMTLAGMAGHRVSQPAGTDEDPVTPAAAELVVVVPSWNRLGNLFRLLDAMIETCRAATVLLMVTPEDPESMIPQRAIDSASHRIGHVHDVKLLTYNPALAGQGVTAPLNLGASAAALMYDPYAIAYLGDDHLPRTTGWDAELLAALRARGGGFAYGDDRIHGAALPTAVAISTDIYRALGWFALPTLRHLYIDNVWKTLGEATGRLIYLPHVVIEHMHHERGEAALDATYEAGIMDRPGAATDQEEFNRWSRGDVVMRNVAQLHGLFS